MNKTSKQAAYALTQAINEFTVSRRTYEDKKQAVLDAKIELVTAVLPRTLDIKVHEKRENLNSDITFVDDRNSIIIHLVSLITNLDASLFLADDDTLTILTRFDKTEYKFEAVL